MKIFFLILKKKILNRLSRLFKFINANKVILSFIRNDFSEVIEKYKNVNNKTSDLSKESSSNNIWVFWWQGYDAAPLLVKKCIDSIIKNTGNHPVILITKENWKNYTDIPDYIIEKVEKGIVSLTHFSDILRMALISKNGGLWLDATIFVSKEIPEYCFELPYFSIHYETSTSRIAKGNGQDFARQDKKNRLYTVFAATYSFHIGKNTTS